MPNRTKMGRWAFALAASSLLVLGGCGDKLNDENYNAITVGMTKGEVEKLLGESGERQEVSGVSISAAGVAGGSRSSGDQFTYVWKSSNGVKEISITTKDGKVISKSKVGF